MKLKKYVEKISPKAIRDVYFNERIKLVKTPEGEYKIIQRMVADRAVFRDKTYVPNWEREDVNVRRFAIPKEEIKELTAGQLEELMRTLYPSEKEKRAKALSDAYHDLATNAVELDGPQNNEYNNALRAARRAKGRCKDYIMAEYDFQYFVTLTTNGLYFDRNDITAACRKLSVWLGNQVQRKGLKYLLVPELHKDGAIHWHGFINNALDVVESGTYVPPYGGKPIKECTVRRKGLRVEDCKIVYNLPEWPFGFTTAIRLYGERAKVASYICKYITKEFEGGAGLIGGRYYLHSNNIRKPIEIYGNTDFDAACGYEMETPGCRIKIDTEFCNDDDSAKDTWCGATKEEWTELYEAASTE